jgi:hypothetical protein
MRPTSALTPQATDLDVCVACGRTFVVPSAILDVVPRARHYTVELTCNNCGHSRVGTYDERTMEDLDRALDRDYAALEDIATRVFEENMAAEIEAFAAALAGDLILPEDF